MSVMERNAPSKHIYTIVHCIAVFGMINLKTHCPAEYRVIYLYIIFLGGNFWAFNMISHF